MTSTPLNPNPSVGYDCWSTLYDLLYEGTYGEQYHHMTESHLALLDNFAGKVLDIGAGTGRIAVPLAQRGRTITAVEPSSGMLQQLNAKAIRAGVANRIHQVCRCLEDVSDTDGVASDHGVAICVFSTIHHLLEVDVLARAFARVAKSLHKGGVAIIGVHPPEVFQGFRNGIEREVSLPEFGGNVVWHQIAKPTNNRPEILDTQCKVIFPDGRVVVDNLTTRPWTLADIRRAALGSGLVEQESLGSVGYEDLMRFCKP